ncbi:MAG: peptide ABC transporter substrate-binding protein [Gemmatimonadota bacterium]|nr:peptide ABC transporter substrate-binding protein [Gemmatimonadota bacterium]
MATACSPASKLARSTGGSLVVATAGDADNLFPPLTMTGQGRQVVDQIFDYLADIGPSLNTIGDEGFTPRLADSWSWAPDSSSIAFHINARARWHDGKPVRASDVRFTFRLITDSALGSPIAANLRGIDSVSVRDSSTAVVWFGKRTPEQFFNFVYNVAVLPEHLLSGIPPKALASSAFARHPVGSGRFRFARWDGGARVEIVSDSGNYRGRAKLDRVVWLVSPDMTSAATRVLAGEADFLEVVRGPTVDQVIASPRLRLMTSPSLDYGYLAFNLKRAPFDDADVRRALSMAVERTALVRNVFDTLAYPGIGPVTRALPASDGAHALAYDSAAAARLIRSHGPIAFKLLVPTSSAVRMKYATLLQAQYRKFGVKVTIEPLEVNAFVQRLGSGDFDAVLNAWHTDPSPAAVLQAWGSASSPPEGANFSRYANNSFDALVDSGAHAFDPSKARAYFGRAYAIIDADAPAVWLYEARNVSAVSRRVTTAGVRPDAWWAGLADWTVARP